MWGVEYEATAWNPSERSPTALLRGAEGLGQDKGRLQSVFFAVLNDNKTYTTQKSVYVLSLRRPHEVRR